MTAFPFLRWMIPPMISILLAVTLTQTVTSGLRMGSFFRRVRYKLTRLLKRTYFRLMNWILRMTLRLWR